MSNVGGITNQFAPYLTNLTNKLKAVMPTNAIASSANYGSYTANMNTFGSFSQISGVIPRIISYLFAIIVVVLVILLFINYFITPIFKLHAGAPGKILIPGFDDGKLFWSTSTPAQILNNDLPIASQCFGYTLLLDVFIQNPLQFSKQPRILLTRGAMMKQTPSGDTLLGILDNYNLAVALLPDTTDLIVSVLNKDNNMENVVLSNIPVQEPFRLGITVMENALEVYLNGHLVKTRSFQTVPKSVVGDIYPSSGIQANMAKLRNLKIWPRILTTNEIRYATPTLSTATQMGAGPMPGSSMCSTSNTQSDTNQ